MIKQKCIDFENKIYKYIQKNILIFIFIIITILAARSKMVFIKI